MRYVYFFWAALLSLAMPVTVIAEVAEPVNHTRPLAEKQLIAAMRTMQDAVNRNDLEVWMNSYTPDFTAIATVHAPTETHQIRMNLAQYKEHIGGGVQEGETFTVDYDVIAMDIRGSTATVEFRGEEFFSHEGHEYRSFVKGVAQVVTYNGEPRIKTADLTIWPMDGGFWD